MGRQVFTAGEILTAASMNDLGDATVMVFDDATARATAIPTPVAGMVTYLVDTDSVEKFDGTNFVPVIEAEPPGLVAVKSAIRDTPEVFSNVEASGNRAVEGLSITHEVADPANRLIISAFFGAAASSAGRGEVGLAVHDGTNLIAVGASAGVRTAVTSGGVTDITNSGESVTKPSVTFVHTPGAGSKTYTLRAINIQLNVQTLFINRSQSDQDQASASRAVSSLMIQEVTV